MAAVAGIERRLAHQAMHAGLGAQPAVGVLALTSTVALFMPATSPGFESMTSQREAARGAPAQVHAQQHLRPVLRLGAAGAGLDVEEGVVRVHLAVEHALELEVAHVGFEPLRVALDVARRAPRRPRASASSSSSAASAMPLVVRSISSTSARQARAFAPELLGALRVRPDGGILQLAG